MSSSSCCAHIESNRGSRSSKTASNSLLSGNEQNTRAADSPAHLVISSTIFISTSNHHRHQDPAARKKHASHHHPHQDPRTPHHQASHLHFTQHCQDPQSCSIFMESNIAEGELDRGTSGVA